MSKWFRGLRLKLGLMIIVPLFVFIAGGVAVSYKLSYLESEFSEMLPRVRAVDLVGQIKTDQQAAFRSAWVIYVQRDNPQARNRFKETLQQKLTSLKENSKNLEGVLLDPKQQDLHKLVQADLDLLLADFKQVQEAFSANTVDGDLWASSLITGKTRGHSDQLDKSLGEMSSAIDSGAKGAVAQISAEIKQALFLAFSGLIALGAAILVLGFFYASRLGTLLESFASKLMASGTEVSSASQQLSTASQKLSSGASEAAASLEETVASIEELSSMVKQNADNAKEASAVSASARSAAERGEQETAALATAMGEIARSSKKIEEIINVIDDIAFQTNLLALNAAVEAARAGEQGKGFAVVAEAVRSLAQRSSTAAKDISSLIRESSAKVDNGAKFVNSSAESLKAIVMAAKKVADLNNEISAASQEQASGLAQISKAMNQLDEATQGNAASAEETAATSEELDAQAHGLSRDVTDLLILVTGTTGQGGARGQAKSSASDAGPSRRVETQHGEASVHSIEKRKAPRGLNASSKSKAADLIPFDDDEAPQPRVGNLSDF